LVKGLKGCLGKDFKSNCEKYIKPNLEKTLKAIGKRA
jgi:hypothetical protein